MEGRLKSLYSVHRKMGRKRVGLGEVFDARALRVVVSDAGGQGQAAVEACYQIMPTVQRLWKPIFGEFDDYIVHPKPSGYQSLHTAVVGPDKARARRRTVCLLVCLGGQAWCQLARCRGSLQTVFRRILSGKCVTPAQ